MFCLLPALTFVELAAYPKQCYAERVFPAGGRTVSSVRALSSCSCTTSVFIGRRGLISFRETSAFLVYETRILGLQQVTSIR